MKDNIKKAVKDYYGSWNSEAEKTYVSLKNGATKYLNNKNIRAIHQIKRNLASNTPEISRKQAIKRPRMKV